MFSEILICMNLNSELMLTDGGRADALITLFVVALLQRRNREGTIQRHLFGVCFPSFLFVCFEGKFLGDWLFFFLSFTCICVLCKVIQFRFLFFNK